MKKWIGIALLSAACINVASAQSLGGVDPTKKSTLPFSPVLKDGDTAYISGTIGVDLKTGRLPKDPADEAQILMQNIKDALNKAGMTPDDLVSVEVYCTDMKLYPVFNKAYLVDLHRPYPARAYIGVNSLVLGAHFEIVATAKRDAHKKKVNPDA